LSKKVYSGRQLFSFAFSLVIFLQYYRKLPSKIQLKMIMVIDFWDGLIIWTSLVQNRHHHQVIKKLVTCSQYDKAVKLLTSC